MKLPEYISKAIRSGVTPKVRKFEHLDYENWTRGEKAIAFIEAYCVVPEGTLVGQPIKLELFQKVFILAIYDNPRGTRRAVLSIARKNGKSALIACLILVHLVGPEAQRNAQIVSGAQSRKQAALVYRLAHKMINLNPDLQTITHAVDSKKTLNGLPLNTEYEALAAEGATALGLSPVVAVLDETGAVRGPVHAFTDAITSSQGAHESPLLLVISTQAPSDADLLSVWIDDAERSADPHTVAHLYETPEEMELLDKKGWKYSNPALGKFRNAGDLEEQLKRAARVPSLEASASNLLLNRRTSAFGLWLASSVWKENNGAINMDIFRDGRPVALGIDLAARQDLTACVLAAEDDNNIVHLLPYVFCPATGVEDRAKRDRAPYDLWVKQGQLHGLGQQSMDYGMIAEFMQQEMEAEGIEINSIEYDAWRAADMQREFDKIGFVPYATWNPVGQGYKNFSPRCEAFMTLLLENRMRHGNHPLLNMAAANAVVVTSTNGDIKLDKAKSTMRIDPIIAAIMAAYAVSEGSTVDNDLLETLIG